MKAVELKGNLNRAADYVWDIECWTGHAKHWLAGWGGQPPDSACAMNALSNAHVAVLKAMEYLRTGVDGTPVASEPESDSEMARRLR